MGFFMARSSEKCAFSRNPVFHSKHERSMDMLYNQSRHNVITKSRDSLDKIGSADDRFCTPRGAIDDAKRMLFDCIRYDEKRAKFRDAVLKNQIGQKNRAIRKSREPPDALKWGDCLICQHFPLGTMCFLDSISSDL